MNDCILHIKWYGPFRDEKDVKGWEERQSFKCSLYLLHGQTKYAKTKESYYCGMSTRKIYVRFNDADHHIKEIKKRIKSIYVGHITNIKASSKDKILIAEKVITAWLAGEVSEDNMLNATNFRYPRKNVTIINEWWKREGEYRIKRYRYNSPPAVVPDVINYLYSDVDDIEIYYCNKLKKMIFN